MTVFRRAVFYVFVALYLILCPLTILYAFGYVLRPGSERGLVKTGLIHLSTTPAGASIYVGRRRFTKTTPATLQGLLPGEYTVRLVLKNHRAWERVIPVEEEKASVFDRILLLPAQLRPQRLWPEPVASFGTIAESRLVVLRQGPRVSDTLLYDMRDERMDPFVLEEPGLNDARILGWIGADGSPWTLMRIQTTEDLRWLWVEPRRGETVVEDVTNLLHEPPERVFWEPHSRRFLFAYGRGDVHRIDTVSKSVVPKWAQGVRGLGLLGRSVYLLGEDGRLERVDRDGRHIESVAQIPLTPAPLIGTPSVYDVHALDREAILLRSATGDLLSSASPYQLAERVLGVAWDAAHRRALCWTSEQVGIIEFHEPLSEALTMAPQLKWVHTGGRRIDHAFWALGGSHIVFRDDATLMLLALDPSGPSPAESLLETQRDAAVAYVEEQGTVFFLDADGVPSALRIIPRRDLLSPISRSETQS